MPAPNDAAFEFLAKRRSRPGKTLVAPGPDREALLPILEAGLRVPDHGKLEPWRLIVLNDTACARLAGEVVGAGERAGLDAEKIEKERWLWSRAPLVVVVVSTPVASPKIPEIEQVYSAGAVCLSLVNAALARGWGANWLSAFPAYDAGFKAAVGLSDGEEVAGFIHIGTEGVAPPERPRPDVAAKVDWVEA